MLHRYASIYKYIQPDKSDFWKMGETRALFVSQHSIRFLKLAEINYTMNDNIILLHHRETLTGRSSTIDYAANQVIQSRFFFSLYFHLVQSWLITIVKRETTKELRQKRNRSA